MPEKISARRSTPTYRTWATMIQRCCNPNCTHYKYYGGRGVAVCEAWRNYDTFLAAMGPRPEGTTLDRWPDKDGNYEPGNCRWATKAEQQRNRSNNKMVTYQGVTLCVTGWAKRQGIPKQCLQDRLWRGWPIEQALTLPASASNSVLKRERGAGKTITYQGETLSILTWSERTGLSNSCLHYRVGLGWSAEKILTTPSKKAKRQII